MTEETKPTRAPIALPGLLVEPSWLSDRLGSAGLRVIDLRDADAYAAGHIPGAAHLELAELGSSVGSLENVLLPEREFSALMARCGMSTADTVVAYDDQWGLAASRLVWALHRYGHERVAVLDGGWDRWVDEARPVTNETGSIVPGRFVVEHRPDVQADTDWIAERIAAGGIVLLDTRTPGEFEKGHLPGAVGWDWFNAVPAGSWDVARDPEALRAEWRALGIEETDEVVVYCRSGMRAAHTYVVLRHAGFTRVRLYDGSWQEWSMRKEHAGGE